MLLFDDNCLDACVDISRQKTLLCNLCKAVLRSYATCNILLLFSLYCKSERSKDNPSVLPKRRRGRRGGVKLRMLRKGNKSTKKEMDPNSSNIPFYSLLSEVVSSNAISHNLTNVNKIIANRTTSTANTISVLNQDATSTVGDKLFRRVRKNIAKEKKFSEEGFLTQPDSHLVMAAKSKRKRLNSAVDSTDNDVALRDMGRCCQKSKVARFSESADEIHVHSGHSLNFNNRVHLAQTVNCSSD